MLLANLSSLPTPGGDSTADPADTLRDASAFLGLLLYVPEPTTAEGVATLLSLKVGVVEVHTFTHPRGGGGILRPPPPFCYPSQTPGFGTNYYGGTVVHRTYGTHKNLCT